MRKGCYLVLVLAGAGVSGTACGRPLRSGVLIDAYRAADCVGPTFARGVMPPTRGWDTRIAIAGGSAAIVEGADMVSGDIRLRYEPDREEIVAVDPGDYISPHDVRLNRSRDRLYVKARGAAAGVWQQTWLYEYDLVNRREVRRNRVQPDALPPECPMPKQ